MNYRGGIWKNPSAWLEILCWIGIAFACFSLVPSFWVPIGLPHEGDSLNYRIPILKWMLRHASYPHWDFTYIDDYPMLGELLFLPFFAVSETFTRIVPMAFYFLTAYFAVKIAKEFSDSEHQGQTLPLLLFFSVLGLHPLLLQSNILMVDNIATAAALASLYYCLRGQPFLSGLTLGIAMASRYSIWGIVVGAFLANGMRTKDWKNWALFLLPVITFVSPFLIRNTLLENNPVYPLFSDLINGHTTFSFDQWGRGKGFLALLLFPYDLLYTNSFSTSLFDTRFPFFAYFIFTVGWAFQFLCVTGIVLLAWKGKKVLSSPLPNNKIKIVALYFFSHFFYWWFGSQQLRFFVFELVLLQIFLVILLFKHGSKWLCFLLVCLSFFSIAYVHRESWRIAIGKVPAYRDLPFVEEHIKCLAKLDISEKTLIGHNKADTFLGFGNYDFVFLPPHPYATASERLPAPDYIFDGNNEKEIRGYQKWPYARPCVWKKITF